MLRRFVKRRTALIGFFLAAAIVLIGVSAPLLAPFSRDAVVAAINEAPSRTYWLGTDRLGRDLLTRLIYGTRTTLWVGFLAQSISMLLGVGLGMLAGYNGGAFDVAAMRVVDVFMAFPFILIAILVVAAIGASTTNVIIAIGLTSWTATARIVRAEVLRMREEQFVEAARAAGASLTRILQHHVLPNLISICVTLGTLGLGTAILAEASLSFLGLGIQPPATTWGVELSYGQLTIFSSPVQTIAPAAAIFLTVLAFNLIGDGLRDALDPRDASLRTM
jgi:ABC-type dipeptide/oligopeptide/nickel transport system permease subunit